jgi:hypothetical protein
MNAVNKQQFPRVQFSQTQLGGGTSAQGVAYPGGLDLTTPSLRLQPGALHDSQNFECAQFGGYARVDGYERVDGHPSPHLATYTVVQVTGVFEVLADFGIDFGIDFVTASTSAPPTVGQVITQVTSGATGTIIEVVTTSVPVFGDFNPDFDPNFDDVRVGTAPGSYIVLTKVTGAFDQAHALYTPGPVVHGNATPQTVSISQRLAAIYTAVAADLYRTAISAVTGAGAVLGVVSMAFPVGGTLVDQLFAFRANAGNTAALLYKATSSGWTLVPYLNLVSFTAGGTAQPVDGETLTKGGVTATIKRVMWQSGAWSGSAVGQFVITAPAGGNFSAGAATTSGGATLTLAGVQTAITMTPGGTFQFVKANFGGQAATRRIYGCDGVNPAFEFDGTTLAPIKTGATPNNPSFVTFHKNFLFLAQESSLFYSAAGLPFKWSSVDGAGEIATGDTVTGLITLPGSQTTATLGVFLRNNAAFLYGTDPTTFNFVVFNSGVGAVPCSCQNLFDTFFLDDLGVVTLKTTLNYGNFLPSTLTKNILPFIARERGNLTCSAINRSKSQYRLFFSDGYALYCTILNQQYLGAAPMLFSDVMSCVDTTKLVTDDEATYAGGQSGYVYQLDVGTSFDGQAISAYFMTAWDPIKSPRITKRFRAASIEVQGTSYAEISYGYQIGYGSDQLVQPPGMARELNLGSVPHWDDFNWDDFVWDGAGLLPTDVDVTGTAENIRVVISSGTNYISSYTVNSIIHQYTLRRGMRV